MAGRILAGTASKRVGKCGHKLVGPQAIICVGKGGGYVAGVETCGSVWACPVCQAKICEARRQDVRTVLDNHVVGIGNLGPQLPGDEFMGLFTIPHTYSETCTELKTGIAAAWKKFLQGKPWERAKARYGVVGLIRALEVTHGGSGWHPHLHVLFLTRVLSESEEADFRIWLGERWAAIIARLTGKRVNLCAGFGFQRACSVANAGEYVAKWGADSEIAKANAKISKRGGRSPLQLLSDARDGDHRARMLFREYALAFKGARHLTWTRGLRDHYTSEPELSDEDLARQDAPHNGDLQVIAFRRLIWFRLVIAGIVPEILSAAEEGGHSGVLKLLRARRLALPETTFAGHNPID